jgi:hypothetical protein
MKMFIDLDLRQVVSGPGDRTPLPVVQASSQDTLEIDAYYVQGGSIVDAGAGVALRFGLFKTGTNTPALAVVPLIFALWDNTVAYNIGDQVTRTGINYICITANTGNDPATTPADWSALPPSTWVRKQDSANNYFWQGFLILNTTQMAADATTNPLLCTGEFRYQLSDGEIVHSIYVPFSIFPALVTETGVSPVTVQNTYPDASTIELIVHKGAPSGYAPLDGGSRVPLLNLPANTEFQSNKDVAGGYAGLDSTGKLLASEFNIDHSTLVFDATTGQLEAPIDRKTIVIGGDGTIQAIGSIALAIGTVTALAAGATPTASITGPAPNYKLNLGIPAGGGGGGGGGVPILGGIVKTAVTLPTWTHGNSFQVDLTNTDWPIWVGGELAVFMSSDGVHFLGIVPVLNVTSSSPTTPPTPTVYGINLLISDHWYNHFTTGVVIPAGALVYYMTALAINSAAQGQSLVVDTSQYDGSVPLLKGLLSSDSSVHIADTTTGSFAFLDLDVKVSTPAFAGHIPVPAAQAYTVDLAAASTYKIVKIYLKTSAGTCTVALNQNGVAIAAASAIAVSSTRTSVVLSQVVAIDDVIELVVSGLTGAADLAYSVRTQPN